MQTPAIDAASTAGARVGQPETAQEKRQAAMDFLKLYRETYGSPKEKELEEVRVGEEDEEMDEEERIRRKAKNAIVHEDPDNPGTIKVTVVARDEDNRPVITRTHSVDTGWGKKSGQNKNQTGQTDPTDPNHNPQQADKHKSLFTSI